MGWDLDLDLVVQHSIGVWILDSGLREGRSSGWGRERGRI